MAWIKSRVTLIHPSGVDIIVPILQVVRPRCRCWRWMSSCWLVAMPVLGPTLLSRFYLLTLSWSKAYLRARLSGPLYSTIVLLVSVMGKSFPEWQPRYLDCVFILRGQAKTHPQFHELHFLWPGPYFDIFVLLVWCSPDWPWLLILLSLLPGCWNCKLVLS